MGFRTTARATFEIIQGKRFFASVDAALIVGIILSCFSIPVLLSINFDLHHILFMSAVSVFISALFQGDCRGKADLSGDITDNQPDGLKSTVSVLNIFRQDSYSRSSWNLYHSFGCLCIFSFSIHSLELQE